MDDNKKFWSKTAGIYERFTKGGKSAGHAYEKMEQEITARLNQEMQVLELAAGPGVLSEKIASVCKTLEVTDFSEQMLEEAKKKKLPHNVTFAVEDATRLSYKSETFDAVIMANALHIMPEPAKAVAEMKRVVKRGGILILPTFIRENMKSRLVEKLMEAVGFKTFSRWSHQTYQQFLTRQGVLIVDENVITGHNFPISFVVCKKQ